MKSFLVVAAALAVIVSAIPSTLRQNRHAAAAADGDDDALTLIPNLVVPAAIPATKDFCETAKTDFKANCLKQVAGLAGLAPSADGWCTASWAAIEACLNNGRNDQALCDKFVTDAIKANDPMKGIAAGGKAVVFWSGAAPQATKFAHSNPNNKKGFVLDDTLYGKLLTGWSMVNYKDKAATQVGNPKCMPTVGWPMAATIVPWERASMHLAETIAPGDEVYVLLKRMKALSVFGTSELPSVVLRVTTVVKVRVHKDAVFNENGTKFARACDRVQNDMKIAAKPYIGTKTVSVKCDDGLGDDFAPTPANSPLTFDLKA